MTGQAAQIGLHAASVMAGENADPGKPFYARTARALRLIGVGIIALAPLPALAETPMGAVLRLCSYNVSSDQKILSDELIAEGWRAVTTPQALKSLSLLPALDALSFIETTQNWPNAIKLAKYGAAQQQSNPETILNALADGTGYFTHPRLGGTLLRINGKSRRQFCRVALSHQGLNDERLSQLRLVAQVKEGGGFSFETVELADGMDVGVYEMRASLANTNTKDGTTTVGGGSLGKIRVRQTVPTKTSRAAFKDALGAEGYLSIRLIAKRGSS